MSTVFGKLSSILLSHKVYLASLNMHLSTMGWNRMKRKILKVFSIVRTGIIFKILSIGLQCKVTSYCEL